jgi:hypothetical protein
MIKHILIVGHQKCGTTSVYNSLKKTGCFASAKKKELNYFYSDDANYDGYCREFNHLLSENKISIDASPVYIFDTPILRKIYKILGDNVLIIILRRDPVRRAISHYFHSVARGHEDREIMTAMLDDSVHEYNTQYQKIHHSYIQRSKFNTLETAASKIFKPENIVILDFDDDIKYNIERHILRRVSIHAKINISKKNQSFKVSNHKVFSLLKSFGLKGNLLLRISIIVRVVKKGKNYINPKIEKNIGDLID